MQSVTPDAPGLMFMYTAENCLAVDGAPEQNGVTIIYEERPDVPVNIIFDDPGDSLFFRLAPPPQQLPDWTALPDFDFSATP